MRIGILLCTYNRPQYLRRCLDSLRRAMIPRDTVIAIVDDCSTDEETINMINEFNIPNIAVAKFFNPTNRSIKYSALFGFEQLFNYGATEVMILDGDAIVRNDFIHQLVKLKKQFPGQLITGFNCNTRNRNGSVRHVIITECEGYNMKKSVGGINMFFDYQFYKSFVKPALTSCLEKGGNWDHQTCLRMDFPAVCAVPSVVQHIGVDSAMGHGAGGEPPDVADDFIPLVLPNVTLVGADCVDIIRLIKAADISCKGIRFGDIKLFSSIITNHQWFVPCDHMATKSDYSHFMLKELAKHITTDYILVIQYDGYVLNPEAWRNEWFEYDYIGAPWNWYTDGKNVGNGGFSFRSTRLHKILAKDDSIVAVNEPGVTFNKEEDHCICRIYRDYLEERYRVKFAPIEEARKFSIEGWRGPSTQWTNEFGFHSKRVQIPQEFQL